MIVGILENDVDTLISTMKMDKTPFESYTDIGGLEQQIQEIRETVELPLTRPGLYKEVRVR
jgi:26S proteasome regulatory subunit T2